MICEPPNAVTIAITTITSIESRKTTRAGVSAVNVANNTESVQNQSARNVITVKQTVFENVKIKK